MRQITVHRLVLVFDADQTTEGDPEDQVQQALDQINFRLQSVSMPNLNPQLTLDGEDFDPDNDLSIEEV